jgi:hypothetical protein
MRKPFLSLTWELAASCPPPDSTLLTMRDKVLLYASTCRNCFTEMCLRILAIEPDGMWPRKHLLHKPVEQYTEHDFLVISPPMGRSYHVADMWAYVHDLGRRVRWNRTEGRTEEPSAGYHAFVGKVMHDDYLDPVRIETG